MTMVTTCSTRVSLGGLLVWCDRSPAHEPPHRNGDYDRAWTMPGEPRLPDAEAVFDTNAVQAAVTDAITRGVTAEQIVAALEGLRTTEGASP